MAARQHLVFTASQLADLGLSVSAVHKRSANGRLHRIHRAVYSLVPPSTLTWRGHYMAAVLACGPDAVLSHRPAGHLLCLRYTQSRAIDITVPGRSTRHVAGVTVHRSSTLTAADVTVVEGMPCTTAERTMLDLAALISADQLVRALDQGEALRLLDHRALTDQLQRNPKHPGARRLTEALQLYQPEQGQPESTLETRFLDLCRQAGLPEPECQVWIAPEDGDAPIRVDFAWRAERLVLEADSRRWHGTARAFENDRRRDQRLTRAGWRVVRVTWRQLRDEPEWVVRLVADLLRERAA